MSQLTAPVTPWFCPLYPHWAVPCITAGIYQEQVRCEIKVFSLLTVGTCSTKTPEGNRE